MKEISEKILIAEDDQNLIECIPDLLKWYSSHQDAVGATRSRSIEPDFEIDCAENGAEAVKKQLKKITASYLAIITCRRWMDL